LCGLKENILSGVRQKVNAPVAGTSRSGLKFQVKVRYELSVSTNLTPVFWQM